MQIENRKLSELCSLKTGGVAKVIVVKNKEDVVSCINYIKENSLKFFVLGEGTNTFFGNHLSEDFVVIKMEIKGIDIIDENDFVYLNLGAGEKFDEVINFVTERDWWGIENLSFVPGTAGAFPVQNVGAYGVEIKDVLVEVEVYDVEDERFLILKNEECDFSYRNSLFKKSKRYIICGIKIKLSKKRNPILIYKPINLLDEKNVSVKEVRDLIIKIRKEKLPDYKITPNAGSFFKNVFITEEKLNELKIKYPNIVSVNENGMIKMPTAWLIENVAEMKGKREGDVGTYETQPLVMVNYGTDNGDEVINFSKKIEQIVFDKTGIVLEREVNFVS